MTQMGMNSVGADQLTTNAVTSVKILNGAIIKGKLGSQVVQANNIENGAVGTNQIANYSITPSKFSNGVCQVIQGDFGDKKVSFNFGGNSST